MESNFTWVRVEVAKRGLKFRQVAAGSKIDYQVFVQTLNNYRKPDKFFEKKVRRFFDGLDHHEKE